MKRFLTILTASALCLFVASSCNDDDDEYVPYTGPEYTPGTPGGPDAAEGVLITIPNAEEANQVAFADQLNPGSFTFVTKKTWVATIYEGVITDFSSDSRAAAKASWVRLYRYGAETYSGDVGTHTLDIELDPNYTGADRTATVAIAGGMDIVTVTITQNATKEDGEILQVEWTWDMAADSCTYVLMNQFWNDNGGFFWASAKNASNNSQYHYWQNAHSMNVMIYSYERIKDSNPELAAEYRENMEQWFQARGHNYVQPASRGFWNNYTDDMAWMSLTLMHMAEATGEQKYFNEAKKIYDEYMLEPERIIEDDLGWGLIWTLEGGGKGGRNACTNTPAGIIACKLYLETGQQSYLDQAIAIYDYMWAAGTINEEGRMAEPPLTYTQGTWTEMCRLLYHITGESKYMLDAETCMKFTMQAGGRCCNADGILRDEGTSEDQSLFKAVCIPYMVNMTHDSKVSIDTRRSIKEFLLKNAQSCWFSSMDRSKPLENMYANYNWVSPFEGTVGSHGCQTSAASLLEGVTRLPEDL